MFIKNLEKHLKYKKYYKPNSLYWGLGIENEFYLEFDKKIPFNRDKFLKNHKPERYSVNYFNNYKTEIIDNLFPKIDYDGELPLLFNSHSFSKTDKNNNSKTLYSTQYVKNPSFDGETLWEFIERNNSYLKKTYGENLVFDGDSIELITVNFYNGKLDDIIDELEMNKRMFIENLQDVFNKNNIFQQYGKINIMKKNHPYAVMLSNIDNVGMFNNGTLHFNITLPTELNEKSEIKNLFQFISQHRNYIKLIQFMEPLMLCNYGEADPLSELDNRLSFCSQRGSVSRYIGIGTYDTRRMEFGKKLVDDVENFEITKEHGWYNKYYKHCGYKRLEKIGYDINFNKHYNHGVEIRFFEHQNNVEKIREILKFLILLGDYSLDFEIENNPIVLEDWNNLVFESMKFGKNTKIKNNIFDELFNEKFISNNIIDLYYEIFAYLEKKYKEGGKFSMYCMNSNINEIKSSIEKNREIIQSQITNEIEKLKIGLEHKISKIEEHTVKINNNVGNIVNLVSKDNIKNEVVSLKNQVSNQIVSKVNNEINRNASNLEQKSKKCCAIL